MDLVEIKKTRRLTDFDIITNLALLYLAEKTKPGKTLLHLAAKNCFRAEERAMILARLGQHRSVEQCAKRDRARNYASPGTRPRLLVRDHR